MTAIVVGMILISYGHDASGIAAIITALVGLVAAFIADKVICKKQTGQ